MVKGKENDEIIKALRDLGIDDVAAEIEKAQSTEELTPEQEAEAAKAEAEAGKEEGGEEKTDIEKAVEATIGTKMDSVGTIIKSFMDESKVLREENEGLKKSLGELTDSLGEIKKSVQKILETPNPQRSVSTANLIEKGGQLVNEEGQTIMSISDKEKKAELIKAMEDGMNSTTNSSLKSEYGDCIIKSSMGLLASVTNPVAQDLFTNHKIRIVK